MRPSTLFAALAIAVVAIASQTLSVQAVSAEARMCNDQQNCYSCSDLSFCGWCPTLGICTHATEDPCRSMMSSCTGNNYLSGPRVIAEAIDQEQERQEAMRRYDAEARGIPYRSESSSESSKNKTESSEESSASLFNKLFGSESSKLSSASKSESSSLFAKLFGSESSRASSESSRKSEESSSLFAKLFGSESSRKSEESSALFAKLFGSESSRRSEESSALFSKLFGSESARKSEESSDLFKRLFGSESSARAPESTRGPSSESSLRTLESSRSEESSLSAPFAGSGSAGTTSTGKPVFESSMPKYGSSSGWSWESSSKSESSKASSESSQVPVFSNGKWDFESTTASRAHSSPSSESSFASAYSVSKSGAGSSESSMPLFSGGSWNFESSSRRPRSSSESARSESSSEISGFLKTLLKDARESTQDARALSFESGSRSESSILRSLSQAIRETRSEESSLGLKDTLPGLQSSSSYFTESSKARHDDQVAQEIARLLLDEAAAEASQEYLSSRYHESSLRPLSSVVSGHESAAYSTAKAAPLSSSAILTGSSSSLGSLPSMLPISSLGSESARLLSESVFQETSAAADNELNANAAQLNDLHAKSTDADEDLKELQTALTTGDSAVADSYKRNQAEVHLAIEALQDLKSVAEAKQNMVLAELNQAKVASEALAAENDNNEAKLNKLVARIAAVEQHMDSLNPSGLDTVVAKNVEFMAEKKEAELLKEQRQKTDEQTKLAGLAVQQAEQAVVQLQQRIRQIDEETAAKNDQIRQLKDKIASLHAQEKVQAETLAHAVSEVGSLQSKEEQSRLELRRESSAFESSSLRSELSAAYGSSSQRAQSESALRVLESSVSSKKQEVERLQQQRKATVQEVQDKQAALSAAKQEVLKLEREIDAVQKLVKALDSQKKQTELDLQTQVQKVTQLKLAQQAAEEQKALKVKELNQKNVQVELKLQEGIRAVKVARQSAGEQSEGSAAESSSRSKAKFKTLLSKMTLNPQ